MDAAIRYQTDLFAEMVRRGAFIAADPGTMAVNLCAHLSLLTQYDQEPERREEALLAIERQVVEFVRIYKNDR